MIILGNTDSARVFKPCMSIIKHDIRIALFMMPFVVLNTILSVSDHSVHTEIEAILQDEKEAKSSPEYVSCTQTLFSVLDFLHLWSITSSSKDPTSQSRKANSDAVDAFLDSIPKDTLAKCSFKCNALSRSLMYYEQFIEANKHDGIEDHLAFLQKIYYTLDEPDGIAGIAATRNKTTSLREQIIEHESSGKNSMFDWLKITSSTHVLFQVMKIKSHVRRFLSDSPLDQLAFYKNSVFLGTR